MEYVLGQETLITFSASITLISVNWPIPWGHSGPLSRVVIVVDIDAQVACATPGEWQCKTARSGEWAQYFSNASCLQEVSL